MNQYLNDFSSLIINCSFDNTYKMAWAKSIVELISELNLDEIEEDSEIEIDFQDIAKNVFNIIGINLLILIYFKVQILKNNLKF